MALHPHQEVALQELVNAVIDAHAVLRSLGVERGFLALYSTMSIGGDIPLAAVAAVPGAIRREWEGEYWYEASLSGYRLISKHAKIDEGADHYAKPVGV